MKILGIIWANTKNGNSYLLLEEMFQNLGSTPGVFAFSS